VECQRFPIPDLGLPTLDQMKDLLACLDRTLNAGKRLYLHCWGGVGRTGTVVGCWLVHKGLDGRQALKRLNELYQDAAQYRVHPRSPETEEQVQFILDWDKHGLA
jgi:protein-tyrosine phosphatase